MKPYTHTTLVSLITPLALCIWRRRLGPIIVAALLASCGSSPNLTTDPAASYRSAEIVNNPDGTIHVRGAGFYLSMKGGVAKGGLEADVENGKAVRYYFKSARTPFDKPVEGKITVTVTFKPLSRAELETASRGSAGITINVADDVKACVLSAAYVQGFLQKVNEALSKPHPKRLG